ncbi:DUF1580 domain-containing protein [Lignipirellula cremea]|uniref:DUF1580 domain-containing protein n=1 Tax=Lignipirellula cremea TaxID=2528010 RepID=UPI00370482D9
MPITKLAKQLPVPPSSATLWRWHAHGVQGVRLETVRIGGRRYCSPRAFNEFVRVVTARATSPHAS